MRNKEIYRNEIKSYIIRAGMTMSEAVEIPVSYTHLRKGLLPASQRPPGAANRHDASLSSGSRSGQRHRPICEKNRPSPVPGAVLPDAKFLSLFNEWKRRVHRLLEARFLFSVLGTVIAKKAGAGYPAPACFNSLVR